MTIIAWSVTTDTDKNISLFFAQSTKQLLNCTFCFGANDASYQHRFNASLRASVHIRSNLLHKKCSNSACILQLN